MTPHVDMLGHVTEATGVLVFRDGSRQRATLDPGRGLWLARKPVEIPAFTFEDAKRFRFESFTTTEHVFKREVYGYPPDWQGPLDSDARFVEDDGLRIVFEWHEGGRR